MNFFLEKQLIKFSCTYWLLSFCKILKDFFGPIQNYKVVPFSSPKWPICHGQNFFGTNHYYYFHLSFAPFHCTKFKKKLQRTQSYKDAPFLGPKWSICAKQIFFWKIIKIILVYLLVPFILQNFKKILPADPELSGSATFGHKIAHFPKWEFFSENLLMSLVSFIYAYLHTKNQSQILIY